MSLYTSKKKRKKVERLIKKNLYNTEKTYKNEKYSLNG